MIKFWYNGEEFNAKVESICGAHSSYVLGKSGFLAAEPDYTKKEVKGKNGDLTISNNRYKNVAGTYHCAITHDYGTVKAPLTAWLASTAGKYCRLEDDDEPGYFRLARFNGYNEIKLSDFDEAARIDINFYCMPQKFLVEGEEKITAIDKPIYNPTYFNANPLIVISGNNIAHGGSIVVTGENEGTYVEIYAETPISSVTIDSESHTINVEGRFDEDEVTVSGNFPVLFGGASDIERLTNVQLTGDFVGADIEIQPRWWTL